MDCLFAGESSVIMKAFGHGWEEGSLLLLEWSATNKPGSTDARLALVAISKLAMVKKPSATLK
jgi:hypothetical protein